jgi:hypothetical protein
MRAYTSKTIALTLGVHPKWVDNLLSHHELPGIDSGRQGVGRRISDVGLLAIEVVRLLGAELSIPMARAAELATGALQSRDETLSTLTTPAGIAVVLPIAELELRLRRQIVDAVETVAEPRRGRPPRNRPKPKRNAER